MSRLAFESSMPEQVGKQSNIRPEGSVADMSNTLTNSVIALYCILLYCLVLKCIVLLIYCYVDIIQHNAN